MSADTIPSTPDSTPEPCDVTFQATGFDTAEFWVNGELAERLSGLDPDAVVSLMHSQIMPQAVRDQLAAQGAAAHVPTCGKAPTDFVVQPYRDSIRLTGPGVVTLSHAARIIGEKPAVLLDRLLHAWLDRTSARTS